MSESEFLSSADLHALTGYARAGQQEAWLKEQGIPHKRDGKRIILSRAHARAWLEGKPAVISRGPNWAALNA